VDEERSAPPWVRRWRSARWRAEAVAWVDDVLADHGIRRTGEVDQPRVRLWSTALTVPTDAGRFWFKENCPGIAHEAAVVATLADLAPDHVVAPAGVHPGRGWMLTPDHGLTLREASRGDEATWARVLAEYADLQRRTVGQGAALAAAGLPALRPGQVASWVADRLAVLGDLPAGHPRRLDPALVARVSAVLPRLAELGVLLAEGPVPLALDHNDLHDNNTFVPTTDETTLRFFDFGDAVWAHPFSSLTIVLNVVTDPDGAAFDDAAVDRLLTGYLERWTDLAPLPELVRLLDAALVMGRVHRFHTWDLCFTDVPADAVGELGGSAALWLELLAASLEPGGSPRAL
jgi:hypothetical protein